MELERKKQQMNLKIKETRCKKLWIKNNKKEEIEWIDRNI
jgi:hypothetical protein